MNLNPLPDTVLKATESINLSDLLKSPSFRHFILSALGNGVKLTHDVNALKSEEEMYFRFKIDQIVNSIPEDDRKDYFYESGRLIREHKERREERQSAFKHLPVAFK